MNTKGMLRYIIALGGILLLATPAVAQSKKDERLANLIERLEVGMSALEELGQRDALEMVQRIANELREKRAALRGRPSREENDEIRTVRNRLKVMRTAVEAFVKVNRHDAAELVEYAMHARELAIEGRRDEEANRIRERAPNRGQLAETLGAAAKLYRKWDMPDRAEALADLSETYAKQWKRQQRATERERESGESLESLATRVEIIRMARAAFAETGDKKNAKVLEGVIHYGELLLEGVSGERLSKAAKAIPSKGNLVEYMSWASHKYGEWGHEKRAASCRKLAEYYARQLRGVESDLGRSIEDLNRRIEILGFAHEALAHAGWETGAHTMKRFLHAAELQRDGADAETMTRAMEGLSMGQTIELLQKASSFYAEWGKKERAAACDQLAEFYAARER